MKILFDQGVPTPLKSYLSRHVVETAFGLGCSELSNGALLASAEREGFDLLVTTDQSLRYQQNLSDRRIGIVVLLSTSWPLLRSRTADIERAVSRASPGSFEEVPI